MNLINILFGNKNWLVLIDQKIAILNDLISKTNDCAEVAKLTKSLNDWLEEKEKVQSRMTA